MQLTTSLFSRKELAIKSSKSCFFSSCLSSKSFFPGEILRIFYDSVSSQWKLFSLGIEIHFIILHANKCQELKIRNWSFFLTIYLFVLKLFSSSECNFCMSSNGETVKDGSNYKSMFERGLKALCEMVAQDRHARCVL